jgi:hypothetical protein
MAASPCHPGWQAPARPILISGEPTHVNAGSGRWNDGIQGGTVRSILRFGAGPMFLAIGKFLTTTS